MSVFLACWCLPMTQAIYDHDARLWRGVSSAFACMHIVVKCLNRKFVYAMINFAAIHLLVRCCHVSYHEPLNANFWHTTYMVFFHVLYIDLHYVRCAVAGGWCWLVGADLVWKKNTVSWIQRTECYYKFRKGIVDHMLSSRTRFWIKLNYARRSTRLYLRRCWRQN